VCCLLGCSEVHCLGGNVRIASWAARGKLRPHGLKMMQLAHSSCWGGRCGARKFPCGLRQARLLSKETLLVLLSFDIIAHTGNSSTRPWEACGGVSHTFSGSIPTRRFTSWFFPALAGQMEKLLPFHCRASPCSATLTMVINSIWELGFPRLDRLGPSHVHTAVRPLWTGACVSNDCHGGGGRGAFNAPVTPASNSLTCSPHFGAAKSQPEQRHVFQLWPSSVHVSFSWHQPGCTGPGPLPIFMSTEHLTSCRGIFTTSSMAETGLVRVWIDFHWCPQFTGRCRTKQPGPPATLRSTLHCFSHLCLCPPRTGWPQWACPARGLSRPQVHHVKPVSSVGSPADGDQHPSIP